MKFKSNGLFIKFSICFGITAFFIFPSAAHCVQIPNQLQSGTVLNEQKSKEIHPLNKKKVFPIIKNKKAGKELPIPKGKAFLVKNFIFKGNTVIKTSRLTELVGRFRNKRLYLKDLEKVCDIITNFYRKEGFFLAKAYLPPQKIKNGDVLIVIVEGRLGKVSVKGEKYYKPGFIKDHLKATEKGILSYSLFLKSLYLLNEYRDLNVKALLMKGEKPGTTDVILNVKDEKPLHFFADYDNFGSRYISSNSLGIGADAGNLLAQGDNLQAQYAIGTPFDSSQFVNFNYSVPMGDYGTKLDLSYLYSNFAATGVFGTLGIKGRAVVWEADIIEPLLRTRAASLNFTAGFSRISVYNYILGAISSHDEIRPLKAGINGNYADGAGNTFFSGYITRGIGGILGGSENDNPYASYLGSIYDFYTLNISGERVQKFFWNTYFLLKASGQLSDVTLPIAEKMSIGGENSVRGYPVSEFLGDSGYQGSIEYKFAPPLVSGMAIKNNKIGNMVQLLGFIDYGRVFSRNVLSGEAPNSQLAGVGGGIRLRLPRGVKAAFDIGFPIGTDRPIDSSSYMTYFSLEEEFF